MTEEKTDNEEISTEKTGEELKKDKKDQKKPEQTYSEKESDKKFYSLFEQIVDYKPIDTK